MTSHVPGLRGFPLRPRSLFLSLSFASFASSCKIINLRAISSLSCTGNPAMPLSLRPVGPLIDEGTAPGSLSALVQADQVSLIKNSSKARRFHDTSVNSVGKNPRVAFPSQSHFYSEMMIWSWVHSVSAHPCLPAAILTRQCSLRLSRT